ncbi:hypothetical protein QFZ40_002288 [Arthrobacter pascens]|nr:hypothetical protein [Arthrobacter pascens]
MTTTEARQQHRLRWPNAPLHVLSTRSWSCPGITNAKRYAHIIRRSIPIFATEMTLMSERDAPGTNRFSSDQHTGPVIGESSVALIHERVARSEGPGSGATGGGCRKHVLVQRCGPLSVTDDSGPLGSARVTAWAGRVAAAPTNTPTAIVVAPNTAANRLVDRVTGNGFHLLSSSLRLVSTSTDPGGSARASSVLPDDADLSLPERSSLRRASYAIPNPQAGNAGSVQIEVMLSGNLSRSRLSVTSRSE